MVQIGVWSNSECRGGNRVASAPQFCGRAPRIYPTMLSNRNARKLLKTLTPAAFYPTINRGGL